MKDVKNANPICGAKTRSGEPCSKFPIKGKRRCRNHGGLSTGPRTPEGRARISAANTRHGKYKNWRQSRKREQLYFLAVRRLMREAEFAGLLPEDRKESARRKLHVVLNLFN